MTFVYGDRIKAGTSLLTGAWVAGYTSSFFDTFYLINDASSSFLAKKAGSLARFSAGLGGSSTSSLSQRYRFFDGFAESLAFGSHSKSCLILQISSIRSSLRSLSTFPEKPSYLSIVRKLMTVSLVLSSSISLAFSVSQSAGDSSSIDDSGFAAALFDIQKI